MNTNSFKKLKKGDIIQKTMFGKNVCLEISTNLMTKLEQGKTKLFYRCVILSFGENKNHQVIGNTIDVCNSNAIRKISTNG